MYDYEQHSWTCWSTSWQCSYYLRFWDGSICCCLISFLLYLNFIGFAIFVRQKRQNWQNSKNGWNGVFVHFLFCFASFTFCMTDGIYESIWPGTSRNLPVIRDLKRCSLTFFEVCYICSCSTGDWDFIHRRGRLHFLTGSHNLIVSKAKCDWWIALPSFRF